MKIASKDAPVPMVGAWNPQSTAIFDPESPTCGIQEAIDALGAAGGCVRIPAGQWRLRRSIRLPSRICLMGDGYATVLTITDPKTLMLSRNARKGSRSVHVVGHVPYALGDDVGLCDDPRRGWYGTHPRVASIDGQRVHLSEPLKYGLTVVERARIANLFPAILSSYEREIEVRDLAIRGSGRKGPKWDFTYTAVHLHECHHVRVRNVTVWEWPSDGIGIQAGSDAQVTHCQVISCRGNGYHPGTALGRSVWSHNIGRDNGGDGFYFCWQVHDTVCSDNIFSGNGLSGIGGVAEGGDYHNIISNNVCSENAKWGVDAYDGDDHTITGNLLRNNSRERRGKYAAIRLHNAHRFVVQGNRCADDQKVASQTFGVVESGDSDWNLISGNFCLGMRKGVTVVGANSRAEGNFE